MKSLLAETHRQMILGALPSPGRMLEWGSGGSTAWFLGHLRPDQQLITVEHDRVWHRAVVSHCGERPNWMPLLKPATLEVGRNASQWEECPAGLDDYILPTWLNDIDVFLIDGVARGACLAAALLSCRKGAHLFMHDAQRDWYRWAWRLCRSTKARIIAPAEGEYPASLWHLVIE